MAITTRKFPSEFTNRGTVKTTDKVMIYNSDTGDSDEFSTVSQLTKIQDDAINAWALISNNQNIKIENLEDEMPLKEVISNKVNTLKNTPTVEQYPTAKITADTFVNNEEALANVLNTMRVEIAALKQVISQGIFTKAQIGEADVQALNYQGSEMTLSGVGAPAVIPDFLGQRYVQIGVKVWTAVGNRSVADWK